MTPTNGKRPPGLAKALAGMVFLIVAAGIASLAISAAWTAPNVGNAPPRTVVQAP